MYPINKERKVERFDKLLWDLWIGKHDNPRQSIETTEALTDKTEILSKNRYKTLGEIVDILCLYRDTTKIDGKVHRLSPEEKQGEIVINSQEKKVKFTDGELEEFLYYEEDNIAA